MPYYIHKPLFILIALASIYRQRAFKEVYMQSSEHINLLSHWLCNGDLENLVDRTVEKTMSSVVLDDYSMQSFFLFHLLRVNRNYIAMHNTYYQHYTIKEYFHEQQVTKHWLRTTEGV